MFDTSADYNCFSMSTARKLLHAYFMGQQMGARYFQDAVINVLVRYLNVDSQPLPIQVLEIYNQSTAEPNGLKKIFVDAYIWVHRISNGCVLRLTDYPLDFQNDVNATLNDINTHTYEFDLANPENPRNFETKDYEMNFFNLEHFLCHGNYGRLKCRYHHHTAAEPCWNLIVDNIPIIM